MPRKGGVVKRPVPQDLKYNDILVSRFINGLMERGKKSTAQCILYNAMEIVGQRGNDEPLKLFHQAVENVKPLIEVKSRRVGGATYQVPVEILPNRGQSLAIRWLIDAARARKEKTMAEKLSIELLDASKNQGTAIKKKEDTHRMAEANKAFAHYRW